ncbi:MAG: glycerol-3-phosphate dehydrogenase/oxidase [Tannerella sp.]|jgi:glycerol-3-phosphate dehydrogenase|nr:glycerol-3-phosphate dehydrogenase/oxidase [Tannerella sp.]
MLRNDNIKLLKTCDTPWDFIVIGGGATGLGVAVDAASRGFKTVLLEQSDFAKATSSRSTKLIHGGVRYLQQGDVGMVREALRERGRLLQNAPHLVMNQLFIVPNYSWWEKPFYTIGLTLYDWMAGKLGFGRSVPMSKKDVVKAIPQIARKGLRGGVKYHDGQFDDARLAINLMQTASELGAIMVNYVKVTGLLKTEGKVSGVTVCDAIDGGSFDLKGKCIVNATGIFVDEVIRMDSLDHTPIVRPSQGIHLVVDRSFLGGDTAIMIPKTSDGRVLFVIPWHNRVIIGTTDTPVNEFVLEPKPFEEEIDFILKTAASYLARPPRREDILCCYAGLRPLAAPKRNTNEKKTKEISRRHKLFAAASGLITITGGKWTTYRQMAQETVDLGIRQNGLPAQQCVTQRLKIHGYMPVVEHNSRLHIYGSDGDGILALQREKPEYAEKLHPAFDFTVAEVVWAVRMEMAVTVDDVLARRIRLLCLDTRAAVELAPKIAHIMAQELCRNEDWVHRQVEDFKSSSHLPDFFFKSHS